MLAYILVSHLKVQGQEHLLRSLNLHVNGFKFWLHLVAAKMKIKT